MTGATPAPSGNFYTVITRDGDGELDLGAADRDLLSAAVETNGTGWGTTHVGVATCKKVALACRD